jgi:hypothetical protein
MTDISKYKNVSLSHKTYDTLDAIRKKMVPNTVLSRSQTINILVNEKASKLNGRLKEKEK